MFRDIDAITFDMGDTVVDLREGHGDYHDRIVTRAGVVYDLLLAAGIALPARGPFTEELALEVEARYQAAVHEQRGVDIYAVMGPIFRDWKLSVPEALIRESGSAYCRPSPTGSALRLGARETLAELRARGYRLGVISNTISPGGFLDRSLANAGILHYFDARIYSSGLGVAKPHPRLFEAALEALAVPAGRAAHVGDRAGADVAGAKRAGMSAVLIRVPGRADDELPAVAPDALVDELPDLLALFPPKGSE